jgi:hypothetical protein
MPLDGRDVSIHQYRPAKSETQACSEHESTDQNVSQNVNASSQLQAPVPRNGIRGLRIRSRHRLFFRNKKFPVRFPDRRLADAAPKTPGSPARGETARLHAR